MFGRLLSITGLRRGKWVAAVAWLVIAAAAGSVSGKFESVQKNEPSDYLPGKAESSRADAVVKRLEGGHLLADTVVVYRRDGELGLSSADRAKVAADRATIDAHPPKAVLPSRAPIVSPDRTTALLDVPVQPRGKGSVLKSAVGGIRDVVHRGAPGGLAVKVTGPGGSSYDAVKVFSNINGTLLYVTVALVFVLLVLIYRSPIFWAIPLVSVGLAENASRALGYGLAKAGIIVNGQTAGILLVLVFGAGTDYALLLVARYREELRRHEDRHEALGVALRRAGPVILASGSTVILGMLCLLMADVNGTRGLAPVAAMGIALALLSSLTLLPALLAIFGRRAFWPFIPRFGTEGASETRGVWRRIAERVNARHRPIALGAVVLLAVLCVGVVDLNSKLTQSHGFRGTVESRQGQDLIARAFPAGASTPLDIVVREPARVGAVRAALARAPGVARGPNALGPVVAGPPGSTFRLTLNADPYSQAAFDDVVRLRKVARAAGGSGALIGGATAETRDFRIFAARDNRLIMPAIIVVVFLVLALLLRAIAAPLLLIATVLLSYGAALGTGVFLFDNVFGFQGEDAAFPLLTYVFLVALGVDYNIFLMARAREETLRVGTRQGMLRALAVTGAVITSAGIVLAGTFSALASLPLVGLTEIGFVIAFGVLLDTFLVRSILVPALVLELDSRVWWPSRLAYFLRDVAA
jgi:RND superfamily putative drug exporter